LIVFENMLFNKKNVVVHHNNVLGNHNMLFNPF